MTKTYSLKIILLVSISSIAGYKATSLHLEWLKYITVLIQLYVLAISIKLIRINKRRVNWSVALPILAVISGYPFLTILLSHTSEFDLKRITDGFFVIGIYYYQLPIIALALALDLTKNKYVLEHTLYRYSFFAIPIVAFLIFYSVTVEIDNYGDSVGGFFAISNCFIPMCLLAFIPQAPKRYYYLGWLSLIAMLIFSSLLNTRSYILVSAYIFIGLLIFTYKYKKSNLLLIIPLALVAIINFMVSLFSITSYTQEDKSTFDKLQLDTLSDALGSFFSTLDFSYLFYWQGNSRAGILLDAFGDFTTVEWVFGRGIYGTYQSFVERFTIELGWAQDCFFWGLPYVLFTIAIFISGFMYLRRQSNFYNNRIFYCLGILILVRLLDGFIYGMPEYTVYNLLVLSGVMMQIIKSPNIKFEAGATIRPNYELRFTPRIPF